MKTYITRALVLLLLFCSAANSQQNEKISVSYTINNEIVIAVSPRIHIDYGLAYPVTYEISIPKGSSELMAYCKYSVSQDWSQITEKTSEDFFNGIKAVRFDYPANTAYVSVALSSTTDSIYVKITTNTDENVEVEYVGISKYYDNRDAVVTCSADDWQSRDWGFDEAFIESLTNFREYQLWVTAGIITDTEWCSETTWQHIQEQLDLGYVEAAAHSRNHLHVPYPDADYEVTGAKEDIIDYLDLPPLFRNGDKEYVYVWIAPYGEYDAEIDSLVSVNQYLVSRLCNWADYSFSEWEVDKNKFTPIGMAYEMGEAWWGGVHDLDTLNNTFDMVVANGDIYHLMFHPSVLAQYGLWEKDYVWGHLDHISNHKNLWLSA